MGHFSVEIYAPPGSTLNGNQQTAYLEFDGNRHQVATSNRLKAIAGQPCSHYREDETGDPLFDIRRHHPGANDDDPADAKQEDGKGVDAERLPWWRRLISALHWQR